MTASDPQVHLVLSFICHMHCGMYNQINLCDNFSYDMTNDKFFLTDLEKPKKISYQISCFSNLVILSLSMRLGQFNAQYVKAK